VNAALPTRLPLEVFDRVRDVHLVAVDAGFVECLVEHASRGTDKRMTCGVFLVTRLLTDEHHLRTNGTFTEHRLRCVAPQLATATLIDCAMQSCECALLLRELD